MGRIVLQMMISLDGMVNGPNGEMDWITLSEGLNQEHKARLEQAAMVVLGAGSYSEMSSYWKAAEHDEKSEPLMRDIGHAMNTVRKIIYSHKDIPVDWNNTKVHVVADDRAFVEDVQRLRRETAGTIVTYGGVRLARSFVQHDLLDEIHLDICPVILGEGQRLFEDLTHRTNLRLQKTATYDSGATMVHYEAMKTAKH